MSSSSSSSASSSSSPTQDDANAPTVPVTDPGPSRRRRTGGFEAPSSSRRRRSMYEALPEHVIDVLAISVAIDAAQSFGRLAAAPALANVFQVCTTWRAVSRSDHLWRRLARRIWGRTNLRRATWREEFIFWHRTASNFRTARYLYGRPHYDDPADVDDPDLLSCRCLTLSDYHLACGFADGTVRLFDLETRNHVSTFRPLHVNGIGRFSRAVSGIVITNSRVIFATLNGDIYVATINGPPHPRRSHANDFYNDGVLVEFAGSNRFWAGLFAGAPGRSFHVWNAQTEEPVFVGGTLTEPDALTGWHMVAYVMEPLGRIRVTNTNREFAVACTRSRLMVFELRNPDILYEEESNAGLVVTTLDVSHDAFIVVDRTGLARVRRVSTRDQLCVFNIGAARLEGLMGCMNLGYALMYARGVIRVWDIENDGQRLDGARFGRRLGEPNAMVANERYVAMACADTLIHLWDFGEQ